MEGKNGKRVRLLEQVKNREVFKKLKVERLEEIKEEKGKSKGKVKR